jgi:isoleucyl-tRNA synthetase
MKNPKKTLQHKEAEKKKSPHALLEQEIYSFWDKNKIHEKLMARKGEKNYFLLEGPPYANGMPHIGHVKNTVFKDIAIRMAFMKGNSVLFYPGFDTHGLPIENMVEKKLGLKDKKDIETFGIANFMKECKNNAALNVDIWMNTYKKLGSLYILKEPYLTYNDSYIEAGWWTFSQIYKKKILYEGEKPVMWCPHCETSLAGYEVTDSYKDLSDPGVYVLFKLKEKDAYLLVFTTTPWTLPGNVAVAVDPKENYVLADVSGKKLIIAEKRLSKLSEIGFGYNILETFKGKKLIGKKYEPLLDVPLQREIAKGKLGKAHVIIASIPILKERISSKVKAKKAVSGNDLFEEFVTMNEGTGMVHTAPGHGKTDNIIGQKYGLACVSPVDEKCNFTEESGFSGFVKDADKEIMKKLENEGKLLYHEMITHSYPLCWRCKSPLIFRLSKQLFFGVDKIKKIMLNENKKVDWMPEFARERFANWVENAEDWNISRQRYWGIPIPLWKCSCGEERVIESKEELEKLSGNKVADLHAVNGYSLKCKCGKEMHKVKGILDVWFDSGISPWASMGYPNANKKMFEENFPVDRINEAQDQIRGWFYSLMFCSAAVFEKAPYKAVSMIGWVVDKNGNKMSKSLGNIVDAQQTLDELGADMTRFYFCWDVQPYEVQKFNTDIAKKEVGTFFNILTNIQNLATNEMPKKKETENEWILSRLNSTIQLYTKEFERFETNRAMRALCSFLMDDLSRKYIQMTRERENGAIIKESLINILKLIAPVSPFISEKIWQNLRKKGLVQEESVHLTTWPIADKKVINPELEKSFEEMFALLEIGLAERDKAKLGLKWPLASATIVTQYPIKKDIQQILARQLNVKKIITKKGEKAEVVLDTEITNELEAEGYMRELARKIQTERKKAGFVKTDSIPMTIFTDDKTEKMLAPLIKQLQERVNASKIEFNKGEKGALDCSVKDKEIFMRFS